MASDEWLSTGQAARLIGGVTPRWVRIQVEAGRLHSRAFLTGDRRTHRIRQRDLDEFIAALVIEPARRPGR